MAKVLSQDLIIEANKKLITDRVVSPSSDGLLLEDDGGNYIKINDGGIIDISKPSGCRAYLGTNDSIANTTYEVVKVDTVQWDFQDEFNTSTWRFTATIAGLYMIIMQLTMYQIGAGDKQYCVIYRNGSAIGRTINESGNATSPRNQAMKIVELDANDYVQLAAYHDYGSARYAYAGNANTFIAIHKLS